MRVKAAVRTLVAVGVMALAAATGSLTRPAVAGATVAYGSQVTVQPLNLAVPSDVATDSTGDLFIADGGNGRVLELPKTQTGFGPPHTIWFGNRPTGPSAVAVDSRDDVFVAGYNDASFLVELPRQVGGYGAAVSIPLDPTYLVTAIAVDSAGNLFLSIDGPVGQVVEILNTTGGYRAAGALPLASPILPGGMAVDSIGDVFVPDENRGSMSCPGRGQAGAPR